MKRRRISKLDTIHERSLILAEQLKRARDEGKITPSNPRTGATIAKQLNAFYGWNLSADAGIRELVNHARTIGLPIGGDGRGYYYARNSAELVPVVSDLKSRIAKISQALHGTEKSMRQMEQIEAELWRKAEGA